MRALILVALLGCKSKQEAKLDDPMPVTLVGDAHVEPADAPNTWPELRGYPLTQPVRVVALPAKPDVPRFETGGPVVAGDVAVISSSQFGFIGIDWRRGAIVWTRPAGIRVAPPAVLPDGNVLLVGDCASPPVVPDDELLVGCLRVITPGGLDVSSLAIRARAKAIQAFTHSRGPQHLWPGEGTVRWHRGDAAISIDLATGAARPASTTPPPIVVTYQDKRWDIHHEDGRVVARGQHPWATEHPYTAIIGVVHLPRTQPLLRIANAGAFGDAPEIHLLDIDATGSLRGQAARPAPGIGLLGWGVSPVGDAALAIRLDTSLRRDVVVGWASNAMLMWVWPLPEVQRAGTVGVALAPDATLVFHDGDTFTVLPELSAPPTTPGAPDGSSGNPTP